MTDPSTVFLVAEGPTRAGGPASWVHGLASALGRTGVPARLVYATDWSGLRTVARERLVPGTIVHTYSQAPGSLWIAWQARRRGVPVVHTVHGDFFAEQATKGGLKRVLWLPFNRRAVHLASVITVPSAYLATKLAAADPMVADSVTVIPNGIDTAALAATEPFDRVADLGLEQGDKLVAAVTTFTHRAKAEGIVPLCLAVSQLRKDGLNVRLVVAGGGALRDAIEQRCEGYGARFVGYLPDAARLIAAADVFVHSSGLDVFAYVVLEAFAAGTPTVVTPVGGIPELVGEAAEQVPPNDPDVMAATIRALIEDSVRRERLRRRGFARAGDFDWGRLVDEEWLPLYRSLLAEAERA